MNLSFLTPRTELTSLLQVVRQKYGGYQVLEHWTQGEFHHDVVVKVEQPQPDIPGQILVLGTNCNGGIKEVLCFDEVPDRWALWHFRCPANPEFTGDLPPLRGSSKTKIWYDPCGLLGEDGPSELKPEFRSRVRGGGWCHVPGSAPEEES